MKKLFKFLVVTPSFLVAQVGINTSDPKATLDVNGNVMVAQVNEVDTTENVLIIDSDNIIKKISKDKLLDNNVGEVYKKIYSIVSKNLTQKLNAPGIDYKVIFDGNVSGINVNQLDLSSQQTEIKFPANKVFKITGMIGLRGADSAGMSQDKAGYITSQFEGDSNINVIFSSLGYTESSTEKFSDGGVTQPIILFSTGQNGGNVWLNVRYGGQDAPANGFYLGGEAKRNSLGTYIIVEEVY